MGEDFKNIERFLIEILRDKFAITEQVNNINLDSLQLMELAAEIEDKYEINIPLEEVGGIKTVEDAAKLIEKLSMFGNQ